MRRCVIYRSHSAGCVPRYRRHTPARLLALVLFSAALGGAIPATAAADCQASGTVTTTCTFYDGPATWSAPAGVTHARFDLFGDAGLTNGFDGVGGPGGETTATLSAAPGQTFDITVDGGSDGRATTLTTNAELALVAGGGGAAAPMFGDLVGSGEGGCGGGLIGGTGSPGGGSSPIGGTGGSQTAGGAGGIGSIPPPDEPFFIQGFDGSPGTFGSGGAGGGGAGSGGDGYYGGGGGGGYSELSGGVPPERTFYFEGGGGGGSGYINDDPSLGITNATTTACANGITQPGYATVTYVTDDNDLVLHNVPSAITTDATSPNGATISYSTPTTSDEGDENPGVVCARASGSVFPIGTTTVRCTATDSDDSNSPVATTFTVTVRSAVEQLSHLKAEVQGVGPGTSLSDKVAQARLDLVTGNKAAACGTLAALSHEITAQTGKSVSFAQAHLLITAATRVEAVVGC
jgi:hypothetical protein